MMIEGWVIASVDQWDNKRAKKKREKGKGKKVETSPDERVKEKKGFLRLNK